MNKIEKVSFARRANKAHTALTQEQIDQKYLSRRRVGKTKKDHESGAWSQRFGHREARSRWTNDRHATNNTWPLGACQPH